MMSNNIFGNSVNPNTVYYLVIYVIIIGVRFFKIYGQRNWREYFFVSLDFVYSSVGITILLLTETSKESLGAVFIIYCLLLIVAVFLDALGEKFTLQGRFVAHLIVIAFVLSGAIYLNQTILFNEAPKVLEPEKPATKKYSVSIPYYDLTLRSYVGDRMGSRKLSYITNIEGNSRSDAIEHAKAGFWDSSNTDVVPFDAKRKKGQDTLIVDTDDIVAEEAQH